MLGEIGYTVNAEPGVPFSLQAKKAHAVVLCRAGEAYFCKTIRVENRMPQACRVHLTKLAAYRLIAGRLEPCRLLTGTASEQPHRALAFGNAFLAFGNPFLSFSYSLLPASNILLATSDALLAFSNAFLTLGDPLLAFSDSFLASGDSFLPTSDAFLTLGNAFLAITFSNAFLAFSDAFLPFGDTFLPFGDTFLTTLVSHDDLLSLK
jgi:hypothetical protein